MILEGACLRGRDVISFVGAVAVEILCYLKL